MDTLHIVMPAYNEEMNIIAVVEQWYPLLAGKNPDSRLVVADSGSSDRTHEILLSLREKYPQLVILTDTLKQHGPKLIALYRYAIDNHADYVFQTDSDGQTDPDEFSVFWDNREQYDAVLGHRAIRGDGRSRAFVEKVVCLLLRLYFGVKVPDANAPFRLMNCVMLKKYVDRFEEDYNLPNIMLTAFFVHNKERVLFREITFAPRRAGTNSIDLKKITKIGLKAVRDFRFYRRIM